MVKSKINDFYVSINEPLKLRKDLLESSRSLIYILQRYEEFKAIRYEKKAKFEKLKKDMDDLKKLMSKLDEILPVAPGMKKEITDSKENQKNKKTEPKEESNEDDLVKFEKQLSHIETKLQEIDKNVN